MRTPLSLVLGSLSELLQRKNDIDSSEATQLLSAYRNTLALQDLIEQLRNTRHGDDVANHLRIARYDMISITKQICDLFVDWIAMNNVEFHINTQTSVLWVWIDRRKMEFALRVLLSNALKIPTALERSRSIFPWCAQMARLIVLSLSKMMG